MTENVRSCFHIQTRVISALLMREIITRYGRNNIGFLWLFVEPLLVTLSILAMWTFSGAHAVSKLNIVAFMLTGYPMMMMWRDAANRCLNAIGSNISLLYHRNVRVLDVFVSRVLLELAGSTVAFIGLMVVFISIGVIPAPANILYMMCAWFLIAWFGGALGLILGVLAERIEVFGQLWRAFSMVLVPISGAFVFVDSLPFAVQKILLWMPMVHGTEMLRHGYFGTVVRTHENPWFIVVVNIAMTFIGLVMVQKYSRGVEPS